MMEVDLFRTVPTSRYHALYKFKTLLRASEKEEDRNGLGVALNTLGTWDAIDDKHRGDHTHLQ